MSWWVWRLVASEHIALSPVDAGRLTFIDALHGHLVLDAFDDMHELRREERDADGRT